MKAGGLGQSVFDIATEWAVSRPDLVSKLIAISGGSSIELTQERKTQMPAWPADDFRKRAPIVVESYEKVTPDGVKRFPFFFEKTKKIWATDWRITDASSGRYRLGL